MPSPSSPAEAPSLDPAGVTLVVDGATGPALVGLVRGAEVLAWREGASPRGGSRELPALVAAVLEDGPPPEAVLAGRGPGSFTGIRVALAFARGYARGRGLPMAGYDGLAALVAASPAHSRPAGEAPVEAAVDALRGEAFARPFRWSEAGPVPAGEARLVPWSALAGPVLAAPGRGVPEGVEPVPAAARVAGAAALLAAGATAAPEPIWTRRSWAEEAGPAGGARASLPPGARE